MSRTLTLAGNNLSNVGALQLVRPDTITTTFPYVSATDQLYTVPTGVTSLSVRLWGAGGAGNLNGIGGAGAYVEGILPVTPGETLVIMVGQGGTTGTSVYGGGGTGAQGSASGGGRSAIIRGSASVPANNLVVAGGGGAGRLASAGGVRRGGGRARWNTNAEAGVGDGSTVVAGGGGQTNGTGGTAGSGGAGAGFAGSALLGGAGSTGGGGGWGGGGGGGVSSTEASSGGGGSSRTDLLLNATGEDSVNGTTAPNQSSSFYIAGVANGGTAGVGGNGLVVITPIGTVFANIGNATTDASNNVVLNATSNIVLNAGSSNIDLCNDTLTNVLRIQDASGSVSQPSYTFTSDLSTGLFYDASSLAITTRGTESARFTSSNILMNRNVDLSGNAMSNVTTTQYGRLSGTFASNSIANLALWLDANDTATIVSPSGVVTQWNDKSGNSRNATNVGTGVVSGGTTLNGRNTIAFASGSHLVTPSFTMNTITRTAFVVYRFTSNIYPTDSSFYTKFFLRGTTTSPNNGMQFAIERTNASPYNWYGLFGITGIGSFPSGSPFFSGASGPTNVPALLAIQRTTSNSGFVSYNGTSNVGSLNGTNGFLATESYNIGSNLSNTQIAELLYFNSALTTTETQLVEGYLAWKWGLQANLPVGHPYAPPNPAPTFGGSLTNIGTLSSDASFNLALSATSNIIFSPGTARGVGIGTSAPRALLDVAGPIYGRLPVFDVSLTTQTLTVGTNDNSYFYIRNSAFSNIGTPASTTTAQGGMFWTFKNATSSFLSVTLTNALSLTSPITIAPSNAVTLTVSPTSSNTLLLF
jgi:hypothetical protein